MILRQLINRVRDHIIAKCWCVWEDSQWQEHPFLFSIHETLAGAEAAAKRLTAKSKEEDGEYAYEYTVRERNLLE